MYQLAMRSYHKPSFIIFSRVIQFGNFLQASIILFRKCQSDIHNNQKNNTVALMLIIISSSYRTDAWISCLTKSVIYDESLKSHRIDYLQRQLHRFTNYQSVQNTCVCFQISNNKTITNGNIQYYKYNALFSTFLQSITSYSNLKY